MAKTTIPAGYIAANAITSTELAANSVTAAAIAAGAILSVDIGANSVTSTAIAANAVNSSEIAANAITSAKIDSTSTGMTFADLTVDTSTLVVDATNNRVGIGDSSPSHKLTIAGNTTDIQFNYKNTVPNNPLHTAFYGGWSGIGMDQLTAGMRLAGEYVGNTNPIVDVGYYTSGTVSHANWVSKMKIESNGNVGIGTSSPSHNLHVKDSSGHATARIEGASNSYKGTLLISSSSSGDGGIQYDANINQFQQFSYGDMIFYSGTGNISGSYPANERMRITNTGNVGIGTSSPSSRLHVFNTTAADDRTVASIAGVGNSNSTTTGGQYLAIYRSGAIAGSSNNHAGGILLGISNSLSAANCGIRGTYEYTNGRDLQFFTSSGNTGAPTNKMVIKGNGNVGIGQTSPTSKLHVDSGTFAGYAVDLVQGGSGGGNHGLRIVSGSGSSYTLIARANASTVFYVDGAGNYYFSGSNQSDVNKKENIADITDSALDLITQLQPKTYNFIGSDIDKAGFIAQEMEQVIPRLVTGNEFDADLTDEDGNNPTGKGIDYMGYTAYLTKAIQEQQTIIDDLKSRIETLENA